MRTAQGTHSSAAVARGLLQGPSRPGAPQAPRVTTSTGGMVGFEWISPADTGGEGLLGFVVHVTEGTCGALAQAETDSQRNEMLKAAASLTPTSQVRMLVLLLWVCAFAWVRHLQESMTRAPPLCGARLRLLATGSR